MNVRKGILLFLLIGAGVCAAAHPFVLCMYGVNEPAYVKTLKKAGFTCLQTYQQDPQKLAALAASAQQNAMKVVFAPDQIIGSAYEKEARDWPVQAWYLVDEPDVWKWSRDRVIAKREQTRAAFPKHSTALVIGQGKTAVAYYDLPDQLLMDWYPVPHLPLTSFGDNVRWAKEGQQALGAGERALWGVVQIFDWKEFKQHRPDHDRIGRFPTQEEIRFMSYDGLVNGADGLFYFVFTTHQQPLPTARPEWWARVTAVSKELARLRPVLEKGTQIPLPSPVPAPLAARAWAYKGYEYILLVNRSERETALPQVFAGKEYRPLAGTVKTTLLPPYGAWVLKKKVR